MDNGDKPGIGIELTRAGDSITGTMYILDPNKPGDFSAGSRHSMKMQKASERELHFSVEWKADVRDDMVLLLNAPLKEKELIGTLQDANKIGTPREYKFVRVK